MHYRAVHSIEHFVEDVFSGQQRADRNMTAGQGLGQQHHVGLDIPVLDREKSSGAAEPGLDFVGDQQGSIAPAQCRRPRQKFVGGHVDALALDGLDNEGGNLSRRQRLFQRGEIIEGYRSATRQQRLETAAEVGVVGQRKCPIGQAVIGMAAIDDARPTGRSAREFDGSFDTFRPGIREKDLVEVGNVVEQAFGQHARES